MDYRIGKDYTLEKHVNSDYDFAKQLLLKPVPERLGWLEGKIAEAMKKGGTIKMYQELNELMSNLY